MSGRQYVDFSTVEPKHEAIDERLINWARWCAGTGRVEVAPMFRGVKPAQHWEGVVAVVEVDTLDAASIEKAVSHLPNEHRLAIRWHYVFRTAPAAMARALGCSLSALQVYVRDGRQMLINRRA